MLVSRRIQKLVVVLKFSRMIHVADITSYAGKHHSLLSLYEA